MGCNTEGDHHPILEAYKECKVMKEELEQQKEIFIDNHLWDKLPEHLLEMVQAQLPLHSLLSFRTVCKQWNMMLQSKSFIAKVPCARHGGWFLFRGEGKECVAFMPSVNKWCQINLDFLLPARVRVVATSGGLLCVRQHDDQLIVCNPFTKAWLQLPPKLHRWKYPIVGIYNFKAFIYFFCNFSLVPHVTSPPL
jgi:hypothetical protein